MTGRPRVSVPVLSKITICTSRARSSAIRSFTRRPFWAPRLVLIAITSGIASPSAWGHAMTRTVVVRIIASSGLPIASHTASVTRPAPSAIKKRSAAARSATSCARLSDDCASATSRMIPERAVCSPTAVTRIRRLPLTATVPAMTGMPTCLATGRDSPVTIDSSTSAFPSTTSASAGTLEPGRTRTMSPTASSPSGTRCVPVGVTRSALSGRSSESAARAPWACMIERISIQWPRLMTVMSVASSHHTSTLKSPSVAAHDATKATRIARLMRVIIPGCQLASSSRAPTRKTRPPYRKTIVPTTAGIQSEPMKVGAW